MGLVIDSDVWILAERTGGTLDLARWSGYGGAYMSAITATAIHHGYAVLTRNTADFKIFQG